jgi:hypothetical protein
VLYRIELVKAFRTETLGWWPDADTAKAIAAHYRRECKNDPGFIAVRVRRCKP